MVNFPFYKYPYPYHYRKQLNSLHNLPYMTTEMIESDITTEHTIKKEQLKTYNEKKSRYNSIGPLSFQNPFSVDSNEPILEILGIKLYLDDIIILCLLFCLYSEGVKDEMLFLSLILLLLN